MQSVSYTMRVPAAAAVEITAAHRIIAHSGAGGVKILPA
jgi:hypothetical protein